jgi:hypothetical protein
MLKRLAKMLVFTLLPSALAIGQPGTIPSAPQLSPQSAYDQVMRPLEITRRSISNWSNSELNALAIAIKQATEACNARTSSQFTGDDLIAYARLCALGQQWPTVIAAANRYITSSEPAKPQFALAYALLVNATLHTNDPEAILAASLGMLKEVSYTSLTDEALYNALHYLQLAFTSQALTLYAARQPMIIRALGAPASPSQGSTTTAPVPTRTLYADGLAFAALQQFAGDPAAAAKTVAELDAALPSILQADDSISIAASRRQYALLGTQLPTIPLTLSLMSVGKISRINSNYGASTVLLLFPDWCAQGVALGKQILPALARLSEDDVHIYALLAQPAPPVSVLTADLPKPAAKPEPVRNSLPLKQSPTRSKSTTSKPDPPEQHDTAAEQLRGTPAFIVPPATLTQFAATDFPLLIATDSKGIIRFIQPANETALNPGDFLDQIVRHIAQQWPKSISTAVTAPSARPEP